MYSIDETSETSFWTYMRRPPAAACVLLNKTSYVRTIWFSLIYIVIQSWVVFPFSDFFVAFPAIWTIYVLCIRVCQLRISCLNYVLWFTCAYFSCGCSIKDLACDSEVMLRYSFLFKKSLLVIHYCPAQLCTLCSVTPVVCSFHQLR